MSKIAIYFDNPYVIGGIETSSLNLAEFYNKQGHDVTFIFKTQGNIDFLDKMSEYANVKKLTYDNSCYDIVFYERYADTPFINANKKGLIINNNVLDWENDYNIPLVDFYISPSTECAEQFKIKFGINSIVIPNIINIKNENEKIDFIKRDINFVTVSRIDKRKGFEEMLDMVKLLEENNINYIWYIVGTGDLKYMDDIIKLFKPYENVVFVGKKDNPYPYIKNSDTFVLLSQTESQCMSMCEALKLGKRCIVGDFNTAYEYGANLIIKDENYKIEDLIKKETGNLIYPNVEQMWMDILKPVEKKDYNFGIIIPNYNNEYWLEKCLNSVLNQTYKNYKIYFIDDCSTDLSVKIANSILDAQNKIFINKYKKYNGGSRNIGIEQAKCDNMDYILCLDSDDWFKDNHVLEDINKELKGEDVMMLGFEMWHNNKVAYTQLSNFNNKFELFKANHGVCCAVWNKVIKASIMPYFSETTLCEDRVHHYRTINNCNTYSNFKRVTHTWNRNNTSSVTQSKNEIWNGSSFKHIGDMIILKSELKDKDYIDFIQEKIDICKNNVNNGIYQQT